MRTGKIRIRDDCKYDYVICGQQRLIFALTRMKNTTKHQRNTQSIYAHMAIRDNEQ